MKNTNDPTGNRTGDLQACSAVPQPSAPLRAHKQGDSANLEINEGKF